MWSFIHPVSSPDVSSLVATAAAAVQAEFEAKWGLSWAKALEDGNVYNAVDGCKKLGIDGETMDTRWGATKKAGELVKFGGGFYCGKLALSA